jgi:hypothetical protein
MTRIDDQITRFRKIVTQQERAKLVTLSTKPRGRKRLAPECVWVEKPFSELRDIIPVLIAKILDDGRMDLVGCGT